jgi:LacI family transcriptional regulator
MAKRLKVTLLIESSREYGRKLQRQIAAYARAHGPWSFYRQERMVGEAGPAWLKNSGCDGIIARIENRKLLRQIQRVHLPTVDLIGRYTAKEIAVIATDQRAVARLGAEHLLERGFKHFAFCGFSGLYYSEERCRHFVEHLKKAGYDVGVYKGPRRHDTADFMAVEAKGLSDKESLAAWIDSLPKPAGLMACNDIRAQQVLDTCGEYGIAVPESVAVVGVDNDELPCDLCNPPLSSIELNSKKIGYDAAALLERMIDGYVPPAEKILVGPLGVVVRQSTDVSAVSDPDVATASHFIRQHACEGIQVEDVLQQVQLSRSTLERRFVKLVGRTPKAQILHVQLQRVKQLLTETDYSLAKIAEIAGFSYTENMCNLFKDKIGQTPGQYRKESQSPRVS